VSLMVLHLDPFSSTSTKITSKIIFFKLWLFLLATVFPTSCSSSSNSLSSCCAMFPIATHHHQEDGPRRHTTRPIVTGTSVLGIVYKDGVLLAADTLLSYGTMAKHQRIPRLHAVTGTGTVIGASGEYSDFQAIVEILEAEALEHTRTSKALMDDTTTMTAASTWNYLRYIMYKRRNRFNPYWNDIVVAGTDKNGRPFLGMVDKIGTTVQDNMIATGFGSYLAIPLLREKWRPDLTEGEARALLEDCLKVLFYRDCRASDTIQLAKCGSTTEPPIISQPYRLETSWDAPEFVNPNMTTLQGDGGW
jgi:20S proteasome subunit beta 7